MKDDTPETPHAPNVDHSLQVYSYSRIISGMLLGQHFRAVCACGATSAACPSETEAFEAGFLHLDHQLQDHS